MSDGTAVDLNLFFFVPAGAAGVAHTGHNYSAHTAHSIVTNPVIYIRSTMRILKCQNIGGYATYKQL